MEKVKCPNPKCGRRTLDIEEMPPGETVLEMKCRHCEEVVQVSFGPKKVHKKNRRLFRIDAIGIFEVSGKTTDFCVKV